MRFTLKNLRFLQYIDYQNVRKTEFLGCQSQVDRLNQPADHSVNIYHPEGEYLKGLLLYVE